MISIPLIAGNALNEITDRHAANDIEIRGLSCSIVLDKFSIGYAEASGTVINLTNRQIRNIQMEVAIERGIHRAPNPRVLTAIIVPVAPHGSQTFHVVGSAPFDWQDHERCGVTFRIYSGRDLRTTGETEVRLTVPAVSSP